MWNLAALLAVVGTVPSTLAASAGPSITKDQLLRILRASEANYRTVEFEASWKGFKHGPNGERLSPDPYEYSDVKVRLEQPGGGRYYLEVGPRSGALLRDGPKRRRTTERPMPVRFAVAYDGERATNLTYDSGQDGWRPYRGGVVKSRNPGNHLERARRVYLDAFAPYYRGDGLASRIEGTQDWEIVSQEGGIVEIRLPVSAVYKTLSRIDVDIILRLDLTRGASIVGMEEWSRYKETRDKEGALPYRNMIIELRQEAGLWVPKSAKYYKWRWDRESKVYYRSDHREVVFSKFRVNIPFTDEDFRVEFPPGTLVSDESTGREIRFRVGLSGEQRRDFLEGAVAGILKPAESGATSTRPVAGEPPATRQAAAEPPQKAGREENGSWGVVAGVVASIAAVVIILLLRRRGRGTGPGAAVFLVVLVGLGGAARAEEAPSTQSFYEVVWGTTRVPVEQCALTAVEIVLRLYKIGYSSEALKEGLNCTEKGVSLLHVRQVLEASCCEVAAHKGADANDIMSFLTEKDGNLALICSHTASIRHVSVFAPTNATGILARADFPRGAEEVSLESVGRHLKSSRGMVLLVSPPTVVPPKGKARAPSKLVRITPQQIDLGTLGQGRRKVKAVVENLSSKPLMISRVHTPCSSCVTAVLGSRWLRGKERREISLEVSPGAWGPGKQTKTLALILGDATAAVTEITGIGPARSRGPVAVPETVLLGRGGSGISTTKEVRVVFPEPLAKGQEMISIRGSGFAVSNAHWEDLVKDSSVLTFEVQLRPTGSRPAHSERQSGTIFISTPKNPGPVRIPVLIQLPACVTVAPAFWMVRRQKGEIAETRIKVVPIEPIAECTIVSVTKPDWVTCAYPQGPFSSPVSLRLGGSDIPRTLPKEPPSLRMHVRTAGGMEQSVRIPIGIW